MPSDQTAYLVSCVGKKRASPTLAKDLYGSEWFLRVRGFVESKGSPWFILSAKYGLVEPVTGLSNIGSSSYGGSGS